MTVRAGNEGAMLMQTAFLAREPVFTPAELVEFLSERGVARPDSLAGSWLGHWQQSGTVVEIRRAPGLIEEGEGDATELFADVKSKRDGKDRFPLLRGEKIAPLWNTDHGRSGRGGHKPHAHHSGGG